MTKLLEKAFKEASRLPELEQNALARWLIDEILCERKWEKAFVEPEDKMVEAAGLEPASEAIEIKTSTCLVHVLNSLLNSHEHDFKRVTFLKVSLLWQEGNRKSYPDNRRVFHPIRNRAETRAAFD